MNLLQVSLYIWYSSGGNYWYSKPLRKWTEIVLDLVGKGLEISNKDSALMRMFHTVCGIGNISVAQKLDFPRITLLQARSIDLWFRLK